MQETYKKIDDWFDAHRAEIIADIKRIVRIPSVSNPYESETPFAPGKPFGQGCKNALDEMLQIGREHGFHTENYDDYVGSIGLEKKNLKNTIGFWNHLDIVPIGNNWEYDPFEATVKEPFIIGRGVGDNKGPAIGIMYLMQCFRELEIPLDHELCLYVGTDEERGMKDMEYFTEHFECPAVSIVPDSGFPVCYGEKGIIEGNMNSNKAFSENIVAFKGGIASNVIPDLATVTLTGDAAFLAKLTEELQALAAEDENIEYQAEGSTVSISYHGISRHSAFPFGSNNSIHALCLVAAKLSVVSEEDKKLFAEIEKLSEGYLGEVQGIAFEDEISGQTTCAATMIDLREGKFSLHHNIRYAITADNDKDLATLASYAEAHDMTWELVMHSGPNYFPRENPIIDLLTNAYNEITGLETTPYVMGGGTYARKLPNAFAYGLGGIPESDEDKALKEQYIQPGHGGAHSPDEALNLNSFFAGLKVFARAMLALNGVEI